MNKKIIWIVIGIVALFCAFFVRIYKTSPGYTTPEYAEEFYRNVPECYGVKKVLNMSAAAADAPEISLCLGFLR